VNPSPFLANRAWGLYAAWLLLCSLVFWKPLLAVLQYAMKNDNSSHIPLIPFIVAWLIYLDRQKIVSRSLDLAFAVWFAVPAAVLSTVVIGISFADTSISLAVSILALVLFIAAGFVALFGSGDVRFDR
jgi:hypothetical protein